MGGRHYYNGVKTAILFALMGAFILGVTYFIFGNNPGALLLGLLIALAMNAVTYWKSDTFAVRAMRAYEVSEFEQPAMYRIVRELSAEANQPMPRLFVSPTQSPNAFATGRNPKKAVVCCTDGLLNLLNERELRGVLGHELMHVYNRDILISSVAGALGSMVSMLAYMGMNQRNSNVFVSLLAMLVGPLVAGLLKMAISRTREFDADEDGAHLTGDPLALASALQKLEHGVAAAPLAPEPNVVNASAIMIANPFRADDVKSLMRTHPPTAQRVKRLQEIAQSMGQY